MHQLRCEWCPKYSLAQVISESQTQLAYIFHCINRTDIVVSFQAVTAVKVCISISTMSVCMFAILSRWYPLQLLSVQYHTDSTSAPLVIGRRPFSSSKHIQHSKADDVQPYCRADIPTVCVLTCAVQVQQHAISTCIATVACTCVKRAVLLPSRQTDTRQIGPYNTLRSSLLFKPLHHT